MTANLTNYLLQDDFKSLFIEGMGWDNPPEHLSVFIDGRLDFSATALAETASKPPDWITPPCCSPARKTPTSATPSPTV